MSRKISRRTWLKSVGAAGAVGLAGCTGGQGGDGGDGGDGGGDGGDGGGDGSDGSDGGSGDGDTGTTTGTANPKTYTMRFGTPWAPWHMEYVPANVLGEFSGGRGWKGNVENESDGRIEMEVHMSGEIGAGTELARKVQQGTAHMAHVSLSNLSPYAPEVDLMNLPFFLGVHTDPNELGQAWLDLHTSDPWKNTVNPKVRENGFIPYYWNQGPRAVNVTERLDEVFVPGDLEGVQFRTGPSDVLNQMFSMVGANPSPIAWGETPQALSEGVADAMHVMPRAIVIGFQDVITDNYLTNIVEDTTAYIISRQFYEDLPSDLQDSLDRAAEKSKQEALDYLIPSREKVEEDVFAEKGIENHSLSADQMAQWEELISWELSDWDSFKQDFAGDVETAAEIQQGWQDNDSEFRIPGY